MVSCPRVLFHWRYARSGQSRRQIVLSRRASLVHVARSPFIGYLSLLPNITLPGTGYITPVDTCVSGNRLSGGLIDEVGPPDTFTASPPEVMVAPLRGINRHAGQFDNHGAHVATGI